MKIISIIPARGGSKGINLKNLRKISKKPLLDYTVNSSLKSKFIDRTFVSSEHPDIINRAKKLNAEIIIRPKKFSTNSASIESVIQHCLDHLKKYENYVPDIIILLQNTSPLRNTEHIDEAIKKFLKMKYDSLLSGFSSHYFLWKKVNGYIIPENYNPKKRLNRQKFKNQFIENGAIYITNFSSFQKSKCRISGKIGIYEMPEEYSIDIDTNQDLKKVRNFFKKNL